MVITSKTPAKPGAATAVQAPSSSSRLFVQNLPAYVDTKRLREHFATQGEVTDAVVVKTKDSAKSRRFGFVGYKTEQQAAQAKAFFHQSFIDTCRINVIFAVAREGESGARPWSKYTAGSSRHQELQEAKGGAKAKGKTSKNKDEEQEEPGTDKQAKKPTKGDVMDESNPAFQEFMETMQARSKSKFWANDDVQDPTKKAAADEEAKRLLQDSEDEEDDDHFQVPSDDKGGGSDSDSDDEKLRKGEPKKRKAPLSDLDFLRSKVNKKLDKEEDEDKSGAEDSEEEMASDAEMEEDDVKMTTASGVADTSTDKPNDQDEDDNKPTSRLFVRNLPFTAMEEDLTDLFSSFGELVEVHMPLDETKRRKGFGFVQFSNTVDAATACEQLNGFAFQGRRLHVFYAKQKPLKVDPQAALQDPTLTYKQKKELERQLAASKTTGWNASFIRGDATVGSLAERMGVARGEILDKEAGSMAVRLAIGETMLVQENKEFFAKEGVDLDAIQGALVKPGAKATTKIERSTTVILAKNLPHTTQEDELAALFRKHGELGRFLLAPSKTLALVEFFEPSEARRAFRSLAYKKFQHVPLYLEWAPLKVFTSASTATKSSATLAGVKTTADAVVDASTDAADEVMDTSAANTLCVKNLSFETKESGLEKLFKTCGRLRKVTVARRKDPRRGMLSMGFGFVEFADAKDAEKALATLQGTVLDGHALTLRVSNKATSQGRKRKADADEDEENGKVIGTGRRTKLIVRNVAFEATTQELRELFGAFGQLKRVRMPKKFDGKHRGFAFVEFLTEQEAQAAYKALASSHLYGRHLVLEWAEDADDLDTLRAKATKDAGAIQQSDRRKRARELKDDELDQQAEDADY